MKWESIGNCRGLFLDFRGKPIPRNRLYKYCCRSVYCLQLKILVVKGRLSFKCLDIFILKSTTMPRGRPRTKFTSPPPSKRRCIDRKPIRPLERQRMRPWLMELLDQKGCSQLVWLNRRDKVFRISWKHAAGQTFDATSDATLFQRWAEHTGKFYPGDKPDAKRWKANFRCALNSLADVEEDKLQGVKKGNNAFKVYRFLDEKRARKNPAVKKDKMTITIEDSEDFEDDDYTRIRHTGTKSRPRKIFNDSLDSEGSENGCSPGYSPGYEHGDSSGFDHDGSDVDSGSLTCLVTPGSEDMDVQAGDCIEEEEEEEENEEEENEEGEQKSPLPNFDRLGQAPFPTEELPQKVQMAISSTDDFSENCRLDLYGHPVNGGIIDEEQILENEYQENFLSFGLSNDDPFVNENIAQEETVYSENVYPDADMNVIVQREQAGAQEYMMYTSIRDL